MDDAGQSLDRWSNPWIDLFRQRSERSRSRSIPNVSRSSMNELLIRYTRRIVSSMNSKTSFCLATEREMALQVTRAKAPEIAEEGALPIGVRFQMQSSIPRQRKASASGPGLLYRSDLS